MLPSNSWCYDLEIVNAIPTKGEDPEPGISYCHGWGDHFGMGISVLVAAKVDGTALRVFIGDPTAMLITQGSDTLEPLHAFQQLVNEADLLIGYGSRQFDVKVLNSKGMVIPPRKHLDLHHEIKLALHNYFPKGFKLDLLSERCGGPRKTGDGARAPHLWQQGRRREVIDYCRNDILMTVAIARYYALNGACIPDLGGKLIRLRTPTAIALEG